jgi:hypothetical protein
VLSATFDVGGYLHRSIGDAEMEMKNRDYASIN